MQLETETGTSYDTLQLRRLSKVGYLETGGERSFFQGFIIVGSVGYGNVS